MKKINEMAANSNEVEIFEMPQMKLIGRETRCGGNGGMPKLFLMMIRMSTICIIFAKKSNGQIYH